MRDETAAEPLKCRVARVIGHPVRWTHAYMREWNEGQEHANEGRGIIGRCGGCGFGGYLNGADFESACPTPEMPDFPNDPAWAVQTIEANGLSIGAPPTIQSPWTCWKGVPTSHPVLGCGGDMVQAVCEWVVAAVAAGVKVRQ